MSEKVNSRGQRRKELERQKKSKKTSKTGWLKRIVVVCILIGLAGLLFGGGLFAFYASSAPKLDEESLKDPLPSKVFDKNKDLIMTLGPENREYINYEDIPKEMENAILATEDVRFYKHNGIDFYRLGGAVLANITSGFGSQGASTLTQQVIKNSFLQNEKTLKRKAQEAYLAYQLEKKYEKEEIFEMYFNKILMSGTTYGFGTASTHFYGKELKDLQLHEMAVLAGIPQSPNNYNPFKHPEAAEKRRNIVLRLMEQHGKITTAEKEEAQAVPVADGLLAEEKRKVSNSLKYPAFYDVMKNELEAKGYSIADGLEIYTTLDPQAQASVEETLKSENFPTENMQAGLTVLDTQTGAIVAIGGGRDYGNDLPTNYAQDRIDRGIGSTVKPILDYGPAIEYLDWSTGHTLVDEEMKYTGKDQQIRNFDNEYLGAMTMREAIYRSRNIPAVKAFKEVNLDDRTTFANKLGIDGKFLANESAAIGATTGINTIDLAASYAAFGNGGMYSEPYTIREIVFRDGKTKKTYKPKSTPAMKDSTAFMVTDMLRDVVSDRRGASGKAAIIPGLDVAGKTGTTNYSADDYKKWDLKDGSVPDIWFAGYTTNYSVAVWTGYKDLSSPINANNQEERTFAQRVFKNVMSNISEGKETARFKRPNSVIEATVEVGTSPLRLASEFTPSNLKQTELFVRGSEPKQVSEEYEQTEVDAPTKLKAEYSEGDQTATLTWKHKAPKAGGKELDVAFEVSYAVDGGSPTVLQTTDQKGLIVTGITPGSTYTFTVVAIADEVISSPASTTLEIEAVEVEEPEEEETPPEGKGKGNGNGNGNGEGTTPPEEEPAPPVVEPVEPPVEEPVPPEEEPVPPEEGTDEATNTTTNEARAASINKVISDVTGD